MKDVHKTGAMGVTVCCCLLCIHMGSMVEDNYMFYLFFYAVLKKMCRRGGAGLDYDLLTLSNLDVLS